MGFISITLDNMGQFVEQAGPIDYNHVLSLPFAFVEARLNFLKQDKEREYNTEDDVLMEIMENKGFYVTVKNLILYRADHEHALTWKKMQIDALRSLFSFINFDSPLFDSKFLINDPVGGHEVLFRPLSVLMSGCWEKGTPKDSIALILKRKKALEDGSLPKDRLFGLNGMELKTVDEMAKICEKSWKNGDQPFICFQGSTIASILQKEYDSFFKLFPHFHGLINISSPYVGGYHQNSTEYYICNEKAVEMIVKREFFTHCPYLPVNFLPFSLIDFSRLYLHIPCIMWLGVSSIEHGRQMFALVHISTLRSYLDEIVEGIMKVNPVSEFE